MSQRDSGAFVPGPRCLRGPTGHGPLTGMRLAVKDLIDVQGHVTGGGTPDWAAHQAPAPAHSPAVAACLATGARIVGKTVTDELAFSLGGENAHHGTPLNPLAPHRLPGGSSSGSASAVACGEADIAPRFDSVWHITEHDVARWRVWRTTHTARLHQWLASEPQIWVLPTSPTAPLHHQASVTQRAEFYQRTLPLCALAGLAGLPQLTLPVGNLADGSPIGLSLVGAPGTDLSLLDLAVQLTHD